MIARFVGRPAAFLAGLAVAVAGLLGTWALEARPARSAPRAAATQETTVPSPEQFFGFRMGAEGQLAGWKEIVEYFGLVGRVSPRVTIEPLGRTTLGNPYIMAVISSPETLQELERHREVQRRLLDPRVTPEAEADRLARTGKAVLLVGANVHSNEIGTSQMVNELLYRLASDESDWTQHVLRNVILLLIPSQNPDGQQMVVDWHRQNLGTPYEQSPLPELYHKYAGHDNNRDSYMLTQVETRILNRVLYRDWLPEVYLDVHQMGSTRARIFVPPFKDPVNPNVDPLIWSEVNLLGQAMAAKLQAADKPGVIWGEYYTGYWQGANSTNPWWHNMVALLSETASANLAEPVVQESVDPRHGVQTRYWRRRGRSAADARLPLPPPTDTVPRINYPDPWLGGTWTPADVVEYQLLSTLGLLEGVANNRELLKRNFYLMNRRTIERFRDGSPYAYVVRPDQRDPLATIKLVRLLQEQGAEVHQARKPFAAGGVTYPAGTFVVPLAQPFGRWVKDILEPQQYPAFRPNSGTQLDRPYDVTAWSLGMLMGVDAVAIERPFEAPLARLTALAAFPRGGVSGRGPIYVFDPAVNASTTGVNRLLADGASVSRAWHALTVGDRRYDAGAFLVAGVEREDVAAVAEELHLDVRSLEGRAPDAFGIGLPRVGVYEPWGGNMDAGWTRWILGQHDFPYTQLRNQDLRDPDLGTRIDVVILPEMTSAEFLRGLQGPHVLPEHRGGAGDAGLRNLRAFVRRGGTVVALGNSAELAIDAFEVPVRNSVQSLEPESYYCPGSILRIGVDTTHPIGFGMAAEADAMVINNGGYAPLPNEAANALSIVASYPDAPLLRSGWLVGEAKLRGRAAVLDYPYGRGRVIMPTFRVQNRGQTWGTFKLLFNALYYGPAAAASPWYETLEAAAPQQP